MTIGLARAVVSRRSGAPPSTDLAVRDTPAVKPPLIKPELRPVAIALGLWAASVAADAQHPLIITTGSALAAWSTVQILHKRYRREDPDEVRDARHKRTQLITYAAGCWSAWAGWCDWSQPGTGIGVSMAGLVVGTTVAAWPYWQGLRATKVVEIDDPAEEDPSVAEAVSLMDALKQRWHDEFFESSGALAGSKLTGVEPMPGGWRGTIELGPKADPEHVERCVGLVARAYRTGMTSVTITLNMEDASAAEVMVLKVNSLTRPQMWTGEGIREDGTSLVGRYIGGSDTVYRWWDETGTWLDAIFGTTRSGKSEFANLLLTMEASHRDPLSGEGMVENIVIDPQFGQSFGELVETFGRFVSSVEDARTVLAQVEAEMYRRNKALTKITYLDPRGTVRTGLKNWQPGLEGMKMLVVTIDECHVILADEACKGHVERIMAMAGKCGIKIRLMTQIPVMASIGNSSKIKEALGSGNVFVLRTGSSLSGQLAAGGRLPGNPYLLPRRWPVEIDGVKTSTTTAGIGYATGAESVPELMRTLWTGPYISDWLYNGQTLLYPPVPLNLPEPVKAPVVSAQAASDEVGPDGMSNKDHLAAHFMASAGAHVTLTELINQFPAMKESTMMYGLRTLVKAKQILKVEPGIYVLNEERESEHQA